MWDVDTFLTSRNQYKARQMANIGSLFTIYQNYPDVVDSTYRLYEDDERSKLKIEHHLWGLYEVVTITTNDNLVSQTRMLGAIRASDIDCTFYCCDDNSPLTLMGNTNFEGELYLPKQGLVYGQIGSQFFSGEPVELHSVGYSESSLPTPDYQSIESIDNLMALIGEDYFESNIEVKFNRTDSRIVNLKGATLNNCSFIGNVVVVGQNIELDSTSTLQNAIIVANKIEVGSNFKGCAQLFARDSIIIHKGVELNYPSGIFSRNYICIEDNSEVNGYVIVHSKESANIQKPNYMQSRLATIRGMIYVKGVANLQGLVSGAVYVGQPVYRSHTGYYKHTICDASILDNQFIAYPLWIATHSKRETILWLR